MITPLNMIQFIIGLPLALFIPGYLVARVFFKELEELEKVALGFVLSLAMDIIVGLFLGYNETMKNITGGITTFNLFLYLGSITVILLVAWALKNEDEYRCVIGLFKKLFERETVANVPKSPKVMNAVSRRDVHKSKHVKNQKK